MFLFAESLWETVTFWHVHQQHAFRLPRQVAAYAPPRIMGNATAWYGMGLAVSRPAAFSFTKRETHKTAGGGAYASSRNGFLVENETEPAAVVLQALDALYERPSTTVLSSQFLPPSLWFSCRSWQCLCID